MPDHTRRRFIAGAVCPRCGLMDKIMVDLDSDKRLCVSCGFDEARPQATPATAEEVASSAAELSTRVSRAAARRVETPAEPVKLVDPSASGKKLPSA